MLSGDARAVNRHVGGSDSFRMGHGSSRASVLSAEEIDMKLCPNCKKQAEAVALQHVRTLYDLLSCSLSAATGKTFSHLPQ